MGAVIIYHSIPEHSQPCNSAIVLLDIYSKKLKSYVPTKPCKHVYGSFINTCQNAEAIKMLVNE